MRGEAVQVLTAGSVTDPYGNGPVESWETWTSRTVVTVAPPEPRPSAEPLLDARNSVTSGWTLYLPYGDPLTSKNRVQVRGVVYPVVGEPAQWTDKGCVVQAYGTTG